MFNQLLVKMIPILPKSLVWAVGKKYIAGLKIEDAVKYTRELAKFGGRATIDVLGEFVSEKERAINERDASATVLDAIDEERLNAYLSIKPTAQGLGIDTDFAYDNVKMLVDKAQKLGQKCRIDMEDSPYTQKTLDLYCRLQEEGYDNVGIVLQAKLKRTYEDIQSILKYKPNIRICKGIYIEPESIAYTKRQDIIDNWMKCLQLIVDNIPNGAYPAIATHDESQLVFAEKLIENNKLNKEQYSFEMLLGVREERRNKLLAQGHNLTVYVPFGEDWYGYSTRRLKENPEMAMHIAKAFFGIGQ